tara:strand:- start:55 stop:216 length:162 start_codon:yes stop_codon:yes gene_type:complete
MNQDGMLDIIFLAGSGDRSGPVFEPEQFSAKTDTKIINEKYLKESSFIFFSFY